MRSFDQRGVLLGPDNIPGFDSWVAGAGAELRAALAKLRVLAEQGLAQLDAWPILVTHAGVASLAPGEIRALGLPAATDYVMRLDQQGLVPNLTIQLRWQRSTGAAVHGLRRTGAILQVEGGRSMTLPDPLYSIAEGIDRLAGATSEDDRTRALVDLKAVLPERDTASVNSPGALLTMRIAYAEAFSLDLQDGDDPALLPLLLRSPAAGEDPSEADAFPEAQQRDFRDRFARFDEARGCYALGGATYFVLSKPLQRALQVVKSVQAQEPAARRAFFRNPRPALAEELGHEYDSAVVEGLFRETEGYSERVVGLGLWTPRVLPWVKVGATQWFGPEDGEPSAFGLRIGDREVALRAEQLEPALDAIRQGCAENRADVEIATDAGKARVPCTSAALEALETLVAARRPSAAKAAAEDRKVQSLLILDGVDADSLFNRPLQPRRSRIEDATPQLLASSLKPHQVAGIAWLRESWNAGRPGVLLADDMGLGKTLQTLAFLAMLRDLMSVGRLPRKPMLVVAPTGLLANWQAEHDKHLNAPGLGDVLQAFGPGLRRLLGQDRSRAVAALQGADWVLTTYETMRDHQASFAAVPFAAVVFDEAQKIKNPGVQVTHVAKGLNADFSIALTGTPVENRLADLWSIVDTVHPGLLGDLRSFSNRYEATQDRAVLGTLRDSLEKPAGTSPAPMLRRLKLDNLGDMPEKRENRIERPMPRAQAEAYQRAIGDARSRAPSGNGKLEALHAIRQISLHPAPDAAVPDDEYIRLSARLSACFDVLDEVARKGERALVFLDSLVMQANLAALIQRRYRLARSPSLINGDVAGAERQKRVDEFQRGNGGFDAMILSPKAGGVGLTLTAATHVIHLSRWWNPAVEDQCTDRAYRIGQSRPVTVHLLLALLPGREADSFDRKLDELLANKRQLSREILHPAAGSDGDRDRLYDGVFN